MPPFCCWGKEMQTSRAGQTAKKKLWLIVCASSPTLLTSVSRVPDDCAQITAKLSLRSPRRNTDPHVSIVPTLIFICPLAPGTGSWEGAGKWPQNRTSVLWAVLSLNTGSPWAVSQVCLLCCHLSELMEATGAFPAAGEPQGCCKTPLLLWGAGSRTAGDL